MERKINGFEPSDLDRPGRQPHQQGLCEAAGLPRRVIPVGSRGTGQKGRYREWGKVCAAAAGQ